LDELLKKLPGYKFQTTAVDINKVALINNQIAGQKIIADAEKMPFADKSVDVIIVRYMLQWNFAEKQKKILGDCRQLKSPQATKKAAARPQVMHIGQWKKD